MKINLLNKALFAALLVCATGAALAVPAADSDMAPTDKELNDLYWRGHQALKSADWAQAIERFRSLEGQLQTKEPASVDAAIYWQAYALVQAKRADEARRTVQRLHEKFPQSRWGKEADALLRQTKPAAASAKDIAGSDDDLAEAAVEGLMHAPPERALPLLQKVLRGSHSDKVKKRALFVLSQLDEPEALAVVVELARSGDESLRSEAIRMLGVSGDEQALTQLSSIYKSAAAADRREVLQAWLIADRKDLVLNAAREESDADVRLEAINTLGAMEATAELRQLLQSVKDPQAQSAIVQSLGVAGDVAGLIEVADSNPSDPLRIEALHAIGVAGSDEGSAALVKLYSKANTPELREAVLQGLLIADDGKAMSALYRVAKSKEEKQAILRMLSALGDDAALDIIEEELK